MNAKIKGVGMCGQISWDTMSGREKRRTTGVGFEPVLGRQSDFLIECTPQDDIKNNKSY